MKPKLLLVAGVLVCSQALPQTYPCVNGISTNPANPINTQLPSKSNLFFNYENATWSQQPNAGCFRGSSIESPFFKIDNLEPLREAQDMKWSDGWELIRRGVGLTESNSNTPGNPEHIYVILYNRYTSNLRVLLQTCRGEDYNAAKIGLKFYATSEMKTDLLELSRSKTGALDKVFSETMFAAGAEYFNENSKWFYADFPMMFDPCTCLYKSKLQIISELISQSEIAIEGTIAGDILTKNVGGKAQMEKTDSYTGLQAAGQIYTSLSTTFSSLGTFLTQTDNFAKNPEIGGTIEKRNALGQFVDEMKKSNLLKVGLDAIPWINAGISFFTTFFGGGKKAQSGPQEVKIMPMAANFVARLNGTITTTSPYHNIIFTNPGSREAALDPDAYPYYNEVLGVLNFIQTPEVWWERRPESLQWLYPWLPDQQVQVDWFKIDVNTIKYVLNPAAGVEIAEMKVALLTEGTYIPNYYASPDPWTSKYMALYWREGKDAISNEEIWRTDYYHVGCAGERTFRTPTAFDQYTPNVYYGFWSAWRPKGMITGDTTVWLKFQINLRRTDTDPNTQNVLHVLTVPAKLKAGGMMRYWPHNSCTGAPVPAQATNTEVNAFCTGSVYVNNDTRFRRADADTVQVIIPPNEANGLILAPNPTNGQFVVKIKKQNSTLSAIQIMDLYGRIVYSSHEGNKNLENGFTKTINANLATGTYILVARTRTAMLKSRFVVSF